MNLPPVDPDISKAKTISTDVYLNEEYFVQAKHKIFAKTWHFIGDTDQVKEKGWVTPIQLLEHFIDEPLLLSRDKDEKLYCLSNVCTHRGNLLVEKPCKLNDLRCKYHGRRFHLNGDFLSMPEFKEVQDFPSQSDHLTKLPVFQWGKFLFTTLGDKNANDFFAEMMKRVEWMPLHNLVFRPEHSRDYTIDANWALYCENYLEGFHIPFVHAGLNSVIDYGNYTTELYPNASLQLGLAKEDDDLIFEIPESSPDSGKKIVGYYFWIFPNMMFNFYPWGLSINIVKPITVSKTKVSFLSYVWDESKLRQGAGANLHQVEMEDEDIVQNVQKGIRSRFYTHGRYSVKRETGTHHFHRLLWQFLSGNG